MKDENDSPAQLAAKVMVEDDRKRKKMSLILPNPSPVARNKPLIPRGAFLLSLHSTEEVEACPDLPYYYRAPAQHSDWEACRRMDAGLTSWHSHSIMHPAIARLFPLLTRIVDLDIAHVRSVAEGLRSNGLPQFTYRYVDQQC